MAENNTSTKDHIDNAGDGNESTDTETTENKTTENKATGTSETGSGRSVDSATDTAGRTPDNTTPGTDDATARTGKAKRQLSISVGTLGISLLIVALVAALGTFIYRDMSARSDLDAMTSEAADSATAEDVAGRYAVSAATLDYQDLTPWIAAMKDGVSPELQKKYDVIGQAMEQIITPLRMQTTAELVLAKTQEVNGDMFRVDAVVDVDTKSVQTPDGGSAVAVYTVTLDRSQNWLITEVGDPTGAIPGGLGEAAPDSGAPESAPAPAPSPAPGG
ncbi:hypothetical protein GIY30_04105 [Gordonia sp. HNM0687]|uniref:Mce-associated membrane protein n=1 Tax=Gordonia mangrovi TaxID=2665643 RepID=A0A6L7GMX7_9ACTN|nr:hypothetical protein [Gordonia mangrovi]MXP20541.1 hypothetical protein [Gordonia mangrovi]UVF78868.1 hypothetical protein NWF22_03145 [Gordonia mangrovi]